MDIFFTLNVMAMIGITSYYVILKTVTGLFCLLKEHTVSF